MPKIFGEAGWEILSIFLFRYYNLHLIKLQLYTLNRNIELTPHKWGWVYFGSTEQEKLTIFPQNLPDYLGLKMDEDSSSHHTEKATGSPRLTATYKVGLSKKHSHKRTLVPEVDCTLKTEPTSGP